MAAFDHLLKSEIDPARVAAIIIEAVQGEGGFYAAPTELLRHIRGLCDQHGIVMIVDEIQTGFARTGRMFALEHSGVQADIVTMAKSLAGGFPLAAVTGRAAIMEAPNAGGLGGTYAGSPVSCAAALAVLEVIEEERLCERAEAIGRNLATRLEAMRQTNTIGNVIGEVRRLGAMVAMELVQGGNAARPDAGLTAALVKRAAAHGLILLSCGVRANVIRFLVPLTASDALVDEGLNRLHDALAELVAERSALQAA